MTFPRAPEAGTQDSNFDLRLDGGSAAGYHDGQHQAHDSQQQQQQQEQEQQQNSEQVQVTVEPSEVTVSRGEEATVTCNVKGAERYTVKWGKYAHDTSLPDYVRQQGNSIIIAPTRDSPAEQAYFQCQVDVQGKTEPNHGYVAVNIRGGDESSKKLKKKRRS